MGLKDIMGRFVEIEDGDIEGLEDLDNTEFVYNIIYTLLFKERHESHVLSLIYRSSKPLDTADGYTVMRDQIARTIKADAAQVYVLKVDLLEINYKDKLEDDLNADRNQKA